MKSDFNLIDILVCPVCKSSLLQNGNALVCKNQDCGELYEIKDGIAVMLSSSAKFGSDLGTTLKKWDKKYHSTGTGDQIYNRNEVPEEIKISSDYVRRWLFHHKNLNSTEHRVFLEAGCGTARTSLNISMDNNIIVLCFDILLTPLSKARGLFLKHNPNAEAYFICGDLRAMPFRDGSIDFNFSDGAIEHFRETHKAVSELSRISKEASPILVTVPHLSISMLTLGQLRGNIPNIPVLRQALEFIRLRLLNKRLMENGYELSFSKSQLKRLLRDFSRVEVGLYQTFHELAWLKNKPLKVIIRKLAKHTLFCPLIYGFGIKNSRELMPRQAWDKIWKEGDLSFTIKKIEKILRKKEAARTLYPPLEMTERFDLNYRNVLDIGCGSGSFSLALKKANRALNVYLLDYRFAALQVAKGVYEHFGVKCILIQGDARNLPLKDKSLDLCFSTGLIEHFDAIIQQDLIKEHCRVAHDVMCQVPTDSFPYRVMRLIVTNLNPEWWSSDSEKPLSMGQLKQLFAKANYKVRGVSYHDLLTAIFLLWSLKTKLIKPLRRKSFLNRFFKHDIAVYAVEKE